jgi:hypothetical protein
MHYKFREVATAVSVAVMAMSASANSDGTGAALRTGASPAASDVYRYIATRPNANAGNGGNGLILGQHLGGYGDVDLGSYTFPDHGVYDLNNNKRYPGMVGARYDSPTGTMTSDTNTAINNALINAWQAHHAIVAITATPRNPWSQSSDRVPSSLDGRLSDLKRANWNHTPPVPAADAFWGDVKLIADGLEQLKNQGIPVVLRPFAELNARKYYGPDGVWHDGAQQGPQSAADFNTMWQDVWNYYVNERHLDNLIFCWEAWVLGRKTTQTDLASWFPTDAGGTTASSVDIVSGAYYFPAPTNHYFPAPGYALTLPDGNDGLVQQRLVGLAETYGKPFGAAQWGLNYDNGNGCTSGGDPNDTLGFYNSVTSTASGKPRTAFVYHWTVNCALDVQLNAGAFVSNVASATADDVPQVVAFPATTDSNGWVLEKSQGYGKGGSVQPGLGPLRTGDSQANQGYRSIMSFATQIPTGATVTSAALRLERSGQSGATDPYTLFGNLNVDVAGAATGAGVQVTDYEQAPLAAHVALLPNPVPTGINWTQGALSPAGIAKLNPAGTTRLRLEFDTATDGKGTTNFVTWYSGDASSGAADKPQLVVTYNPKPH